MAEVAQSVPAESQAKHVVYCGDTPHALEPKLPVFLFENKPTPPPPPLLVPALYYLYHPKERVGQPANISFEIE
ncbi:RNA binding protein Tma22 [Aspergillus luchuensis]|uniref:RNA binding protein Tma22 n=1 Tax=Aspergillus kawachii TaxID=1069201 RepID=A0A146FY54_ASPKA|nr:RNA binding protein Tma22 [Aspergillus luchuensis]